MERRHFTKSDDLFIEQVKRDANYTFQTSHNHPYFEVGYLMNGTRSMIINHSLYNLKKGDVIIVFHGELHKGFPVEHHPTDVELIFLYFMEDYLAPLYQLFSKEQLEVLFEKRCITIPAGLRDHVETLLKKMLYESKNIDEFSRKLLQSYFYELFTLLVRFLRTNTAPAQMIDKGNEVMEDAVKYIYFNCAKDLTLEEVASKYNMSKSYFSKRFKAVTGFGYKEYLINVRLKEACNLLLTTNQTITEIAFACGFNDSNYFGDAFRKTIGVSPHKYRKCNGLL